MNRDDELDNLPDNLRLIIQLTDYRTALIFIKHFGGSDYYFPSRYTIDVSHELSELLGFNNAKRLCEYWSDVYMYIPKADSYLGKLRDKRIEQDLITMGADTKSQREIAKKYNVTTRWIRSIRKKQVEHRPIIPKFDRQLDLFA